MSLSFALPYTGIRGLPATTLLGNSTGAAGPAEALTASQGRTLLGLVIGTNVQAYNAATLFGALGATDNAILRSDGTGGVTAQGSTIYVSDAGLLQLAGITSSFPALKRSSAIVQARLADDSAYAAMEGLSFTAYESAGVKNVSLSHNGTNAIASNSSGDIRFLTSSGIFYFNPTSGGMDRFTLNVGNSVAYLTLASVSNGSMAIDGRATSVGLRAELTNGGGYVATLYLAAAAVWGLGGNGSSSGRSTLASSPLTPSQITSNQDNYAPGVARFYRLSTDASRDITGLSCSQVTGQECEFWNVGSTDIVLKHDVTSTAANRFLCTAGADITLAANEVALLRYDGTTARWRVRKV